jgi:dihydrofolate reductase
LKPESRRALAIARARASPWRSTGLEHARSRTKADYAGWAGYWPGASGPFAKPMDEIPKVVFSDSLASADWGETTIATGDLAAAVTRLKQERSDGYLLAHGGVRFARSLVARGLIDEYRSGGAVAHVFAAHA